MHILLVEDDAGISTPLTAYLEQAGHTVILSERGDTAEELFQQEKPSLIILDLNLPGKSGYDVCEGIRKVSRTPILVLSARTSEDDKVELLDIGADDYVSKPFSPRELVARVHAIGKRFEERKDQKQTKNSSLGRLTIDTKNYAATVDGSELKLTKTEFLILEYLIKNMKGVIKRESLMKDIIGYENYLYDRTIDTHIKNLRKKLDGAIEIETIRGIGYKVSTEANIAK